MSRRHDQRDLSNAAQEYLLALRVMAGVDDAGRVTTAQVARHLGVTTQAASEMFRRLVADGLVAHAEGRDLHLTPAGRAAADGIFRRHALLEWLLTAVIGLGWAESDDEAMRLQGAISPRVEARLDEMLGHPETCPHGNPIDAETARRRPAGVPLSEMEAGAPATIFRITEEAEEDAGLLSYLEARALTPGRPDHDPRAQRIARLPDARRPARPRDARASAGGADPGPARRGRPRAVSSGSHSDRASRSGSPRARPGQLHIGTARTALFNYLYARRTGGTFILRLEDTDQARGSIAYEKDILDGLHWLGLAWDEGPEVAGGADIGGRSGRIARCSGSAVIRPRPRTSSPATSPIPATARRRSSRPIGRRRKPPTSHRATSAAARISAPRSARPARPRARAAPSASAFRAGKIGWHDLVRGEVEFDTANIGGDFVIVRSDGTPLYHFAVVVDDATMEITHIIRGEDHISNTPKHILLFRALGHAEPQFAHLPLILNADRTKMSKRKSQTAVADYIARGVHPRGAGQLPRAPRLVHRDGGGGPHASTRSRGASTSPRVHKGGAVFDRERLEWLNGQWIRRLEPDDLVDRLRPFVEADLAAGRIDRMPSDAELRSLLPIIGERLPTLGAVGDLVGFLWIDRLAVDPATLVPKRWDAATTARGAGGRASHDRRRRIGRVRGRRARAAAPCARRGSRLEGRRPVHGHPRRGDRPDRHAAAVRHARRARSRAHARSDRRGDRHARGREGAPMTHADVQRWLDRYIAAWSSYDPKAIGDLFTDDAEYRYQPWADPVVGREAIVADWLENKDGARHVDRELRRLDVRRGPGVGGRREPLHQPGRLVPDAVLQQLAAPLRRPRPLRQLRRVLHGAARTAARRPLTRRSG